MDMKEKITELLEQKNYAGLKEYLSAETPQDIAQALSDLDEEQILFAYRFLPKYTSA